MPCKTVLYRLSVPGWEEGRTVRIGLLADLHNNFSPGLIQTIRAGSPDLLVSAGDMTTSRHAGGPQLFARAYGLLSALAAEFPLYLANGNHEARWKADPGRAALFDAFRRGLLRKGALFLENASVTLSLHGVSLRLSGLDLPIEYSVRVFDPAARKKRRLPEGLSRARFTGWKDSISAACRKDCSHSSWDRPPPSRPSRRFSSPTTPKTSRPAAPGARTWCSPGTSTADSSACRLRAGSSVRARNSSRHMTGAFLPKTAR